MPLAWNEIRHRAIRFANDWSRAVSEAADKQTFWNEFFEVFGIARKTVASFEAPVRKVSGHDGYIDLFWKGVLLVEHKSAGGDLGKAQSQAFDYIQSLATDGKHAEIPRYVIVSDFARIVLYDLEPDEQLDLPRFNGRRVQVAAEFPLQEFHKQIRPFAFMAGYKQQKLDPEDPANLEATEIMAALHDALKAGGYTGHELRQFLVRILFCLFAEDTGIFGQPRQFELYLLNHTAPDGSDLGTRLARLFEVLNTPEDRRQTHLDTDIGEFPYVNGDLFKERLTFADFNRDMRDALLAACRFRWEKISPAVFGSLFQDVMLPKERRQIGAHYTAEKNIMKLIRSLFLDEFWAGLESIKMDKSTRGVARLDDLHQKLAGLRLFDPACGCGNFLVIAYRELRRLELEILKFRYEKQKSQGRDVQVMLSLLDVDQMYGIEIEEFPARIAEVALWLADHQANTELSLAFAQRYLRIPLRKSPHIQVGNALREDWNQLLPAKKCSYILGNPPFVGKQFMSAEQKADMAAVCGRVKGGGVLDFVTGWYFKAADYVRGTNIQCAFVSTNSISQGEQPGVLWADLYSRFQTKIHFAHRTFPWESEARGKAHVHVVIIGFGAGAGPGKVITDYEHDVEHPTSSQVTNINPYLVQGSDTVLTKRSTPVCEAPEIAFGSMPNDGGHLLLEPEDKRKLLQESPEASRFVRPYYGPDEFIKGNKRFCLWLVDATPDELRDLPEVMRRIEAVREERTKSKRTATKELAKTPFLFGEIRQPAKQYLAIPKTSSEKRACIPMAFLKPAVIAGADIFTIPNAGMFHFGVLTSQIHMAWVRYVCGRLKSDYRYSAGIVYNNFPWPPSSTVEQKSKVEAAAQAVLKARADNPDSTLASLYDPLTMPAALVKAHTALDRAVDRCYRKEPFPNDRARVEFLFKLYEQLTAPLIAATKARRPRSRKETIYPPKPPDPPAPQHPGPTREQAEGDAAHYFSAKEDPIPYGTRKRKD